jgi:hypothetical protein
MSSHAKMKAIHPQKSFIPENMLRECWRRCWIHKSFLQKIPQSPSPLCFDQVQFTRHPRCQLFLRYVVMQCYCIRLQFYSYLTSRLTALPADHSPCRDPFPILTNCRNVINRTFPSSSHLLLGSSYWHPIPLVLSIFQLHWNGTYWLPVVLLVPCISVLPCRMLQLL